MSTHTEQREHEAAMARKRLDALYAALDHARGPESPVRKLTLPPDIRVDFLSAQERMAAFAEGRVGAEEVLLRIEQRDLEGAACDPSSGGLDAYIGRRFADAMRQAQEQVAAKASGAYLLAAPPIAWPQPTTLDPGGHIYANWSVVLFWVPSGGAA